MPPPFRIAILECDTPLAGTRSRYGSYGGVFTSLLHCAADTLSIPRRDIEISTWDVVHKMEYPAAAASSSSPSSSLEDIDAVLMTGSSMCLMHATYYNRLFPKPAAMPPPKEAEAGTESQEG